MSQAQTQQPYYDWREKMSNAISAASRARRMVGTWFSRSRVPEVVTSLICLGLLALSLTLILDADRYVATPTFADALGPDGLAAPEVWGILLAAPCTATLLSLAAHRRDVYWPLFAIVGWMTAFSFFIAKSVGDAKSVSSPVTIYVTISVVLAVLAIMYAREGERP